MSNQIMQMMFNMLGVKPENAAQIAAFMEEVPTKAAQFQRDLATRLDNQDKALVYIINQNKLILENQAGILAWQAERTDENAPSTLDDSITTVEPERTDGGGGLGSADD